ncbi:acyltransferase [Sphingomonas sp.]|uniref:acyltransferase family protein n=1 Tax=Sphingomonas sp. TaxID=28214 RepID=UPI000DB79DDC|nr:acyltransferase [Sphingomonas sp.]PZU11647.1 MAG: acyltransferase [Sphingomonas sp.]
MNHIRALDGLRALAVSIVFVAHCGLERLVPGGLGVTIFFFLSGYLITSLLRSEVAQLGKVDLRGFYMRRTLRIWPSLYLTVAFTGLVSLFMPIDPPIQATGVVAQLAFLSNYAGQLGLGAGVPWIPLWSLAVEEHFYLLFPILFATILLGRAPRTIALWCAVGCLLVLAVRIVSVPLLGENIGQIYYWSHTRIDSILFGCCLALWQNPVLDEAAWRPKPWHFAAAVAVLLLCLLVRSELFRQTLRYTLQGAALFVIFSFVIWDRGLIARWLSCRPARLIGLYSYTLYLVHVPIIELIRFLRPGLPILAMIPIAGVLSMLYAAAMYRLVEAPAARWRRSLHRVDADVDMVPAG